MDGMDIDVATAAAVDAPSVESAAPPGVAPAAADGDAVMADAPSKTFSAIENGYAIVEAGETEASPAPAVAEVAPGAAEPSAVTDATAAPSTLMESAPLELSAASTSEEDNEAAAVSIAQAIIELADASAATAESTAPAVDTAEAELSQPAEVEALPTLPTAVSPTAAAAIAPPAVVAADLGPASAPLVIADGTAVASVPTDGAVSPAVAASSTAPLPPTIPSPPVPADSSSPTVAAHPASPKAKPKRKRNAAAGPSRAARPAHWMGEDNGVIRCICGMTEDDGFTIQCEGCNAWEHGQCFGYLDEASAPDNYFCELCDPRPFDPVGARQRQLDARAANLARIPEEPDRKQRPKTKRPRTESTVAEDEDAAAGKPRRRPAAQKPRSKQAAEPVPAPVPEQEDDYFAVDPWEFEYTPVKDNVVRGWAARQAIRRFYREWVEEEPRRVQHDSGLPSPTDTGVLRLSPDAILPPLDYSVLAPPVPPVQLPADFASHAASTSIQLIDDVLCFLPPTYDADPTAVIYPRPTMYGVFAEDTIATAAFVGEYRAEILDAEAYRHDPINQYAHLGLPKPHVRALGPPVNLVLDARGYGSDMRFVRSACHPNAVLRPVLADGRLKFGVFAARDISKGEEIVLAWEWDDQHIVHALRTSEDPSVLASKYDAVLTHLLGTFSSCACTSAQTCALAQMARLVEGKNATRRRGLGELVGAVRGWRRDEMEAGRVKQLDRSLALDLFAPSPTSASPDPPMKEMPGVPTPPSPPALFSPRSVRISSSSELSAAPDREEEGEPELDDGAMSDATTATVVRDYTPSEDEMDVDEAEVGTVSDGMRATVAAAESQDEDDDIVRRPVGGRRRRVSSPPSKPVPQRKPSPPLRKPADKPRSDGRRDKARRARKVIASSDDEADESRTPTSRPSPVARASTARAVEPRATVPEQVVAPMAEPMDEDAVFSADAPGVAEEARREPTPVREPTPREATPVREPTPKEPTPPPEPPKKVAFSEYLKNHKIRKVSQPTPDAVAEVKPEPEAPAPAPTPSTALGLAASSMVVASAMAAPTMAAPATPAAPPAPAMTPAKDEPRVNLFEHLPTRTPSATPALSPYTPSAASAYQPRTDYFPPQNSSAYVPRAREDSTASTPGAASAYTPRDPGTPAADASATPLVLAYMPREPSTPAAAAEPAAHLVREFGATPTPHANTLALSSVGGPAAPSGSPPSTIPPPAMRELPPHAYERAGVPGYGPNAAGGPARPPPTGPRNAPMGPRGSWGGPVSPTAPMRPLGFGRGGSMGGGGGGLGGPGGGGFRGADRGFFRGGRGAFRGRGR